MTKTSTTKVAEKLDFSRCVQNRELSWLKFNERVLEEANWKGNPPLESLKFISIFCSNLDEFFMVRVGSLTDYMLYAPKYFDNKTGMTAEEQLDAIYRQTASLCALKDRYFSSVVEELNQNGVHHVQMRDMELAEKKELEKYFIRNVLPLLSPQIIDNRHPFPHMDNKQLYVAVTLESKNKPVFGLLAMPKTLDRLHFLEGHCRYVLLEDMMCYFSHHVFKPYSVLEKTILAVTRNADIDTEQDDTIDEDIDYRQFMQKVIKKRQRLAPVRIEFQHEVSRPFMAFFCVKLNLEEKQVFYSASPLDFSFCFTLDDRVRAESQKNLIIPTHVPYDVFPVDKKVNLWKEATKKDLLFSYPFESILPFLEIVKQAADDPTVLSIKITLYRIDFQSRIAESLIRAAENGKEVIVLMELRARFDESNNIEWSVRLEEAGCRLIYGFSEYKVHAKICLITKREFGRVQYLTQIGTGNYNEKTTKLYTDLSLITANQEIGADAATFFHSLLLGETSESYTHLWVAPNAFKQRILQSIEEEQIRAENGEDAQIIMKCNSLTDREVVMKLIEASQSGVKISMIVRGICCLIPRIPEYTHNIRIISIVGRFLEHSRIYCFGTGENKKVYLSSADLMTRNTERRVEVACPVLDTELRERICEILETMLRDNTKAWEQFSDGRYIRRSAPADLVINSQEMFIEQARIQHIRSGHTPVGTKQRKGERGVPSVLSNFMLRLKTLL